MNAQVKPIGFDCEEFAMETDLGELTVFYNLNRDGTHEVTGFQLGGTKLKVDDLCPLFQDAVDEEVSCDAQKIFKGQYR